MSDVLRAVDEALDTGRAAAVDPLERELQEIGLALRADAPVVDAGFASELERRVERRFARERGRRGGRRRRFAFAGALAVGAVAVGGAVVGLVAGEGGGPSRNVGIESAPVPAPKSSAPTAAVPMPAPLAASGHRRVEREAQLTLAASQSKLDNTANGIVEVAARHRGIVLDSSFSTGSDSGHGGSFTLRVPSSELGQTMRDLSRLGEVRSRSQSGHDVTGSYNRLADHLDAARLERHALRRRLAHAASTAEADRIRTRLEELGVEIQELSGNVASLRHRTDFTRISVTLVEEPGQRGVLGGAGDAMRGSLRALVRAAAITLRVVAAMLPVALLGAAAWAGAAAFRRRRREAALS